jgi:hypothetical protein
VSQADCRPTPNCKNSVLCTKAPWRLLTSISWSPFLGTLHCFSCCLVPGVLYFPPFLQFEERSTAPLPPKLWVPERTKQEHSNLRIFPRRNYLSIVQSAFTNVFTFNSPHNFATPIGESTGESQSESKSISMSFRVLGSQVKWHLHVTTPPGVASYLATPSPSI